MARLTLVTRRREDDTLILELKRDVKNDPPILAIMATLFCFMALLSCIRSEGAVAFLEIVIIATLFSVGLVYLFQAACLGRVLRLNAETLRVETHFRSLAPGVDRILSEIDRRAGDAGKENFCLSTRICG